MKHIIKETERGFLFRNGKFIRMLEPGCYHTLGNAEIRRVALTTPLSDVFDFTMLQILRRHEPFSCSVVTLDVADAQIALHYVNGVFEGGLKTGRYVFWHITQEHRFELFDLTSPDVPDSIPRHVCESLCGDGLMTAVRIPEHARGMLQFDGRLERILEPGVYYFWNTDIKVSCETADTRLQQLGITGQEILTKDKVNIRLNFMCSYRITDFVKIHQEIRDYASQFYIAVQMTARECIAGYTLDELLAQRESIAREILVRLQEKGSAMYIEVCEAGIRDIILPGEVRDIMNTVLIAEKRAQANVITRREEVASTRSLLNTAKLMEENKTLYKLKELEYLEKICENVGSISVSGGDLLEHLRAIVGSAS